MKMFSIIVPIYKVESYIKECIETVVNQNYDNYELILVDDGSPDNSGRICDEYKKKYSNIVVIHKENGGISDARNAGIKAAKGKYIMFLDGDDTLNAGVLQKIANILDEEEVDILSGNYNIYGSESNQNDYILKRIDVLNDYLIYLNEIPWAVWRNVFNRRVIDENNIEFAKELICAEDCDFFLDFFDKATNKKYTNINIINYRTNRDGSITNSISYNAIIGQLKVFSRLFYKYYNQENKEIYEMFAKKYLNTITTIYHVEDKEHLKQIYNNINENKVILKKVKGFKYNIAKFLWSIFGFKNGSRIMKLIK